MRQSCKDMSEAPITRRSTPAPAVLIVEDEVRMREMLLRAVAEIGYVATSVGSAEQALKVLRRPEVEHPRIVLLDLNLPGLNGMEFLERLRTDELDVQVIILTGFGSLEAARTAIRHDVADFLTKPCRLDELEVALSRAQSRLRRQLPQVEGVEPAASDPAGTLEDVERQHILAALERHNGNRALAAAELGISERTLYYRLARYSRGA